jgi:hypothetical protein
MPGVRFVHLVGFASDGAPLIVDAREREAMPRRCRSVQALGPEAVGREVAVVFEEGDPSRPIVVGVLQLPVSPNEAVPTRAASTVGIEADGERLQLTAEREIVLKCGAASITLTRAGKVIIRGSYVLSRSSGINLIKGAAVQIN